MTKNRRQDNDLEKYGWQVAKLLSGVTSPRQMDNVLRELLSPKEYEEIGLRWQLLKELDSGKSHRDIRNNLGVGVATIARGSRVLADKKSAVSKILRKL